MVYVLGVPYCECESTPKKPIMTSFNSSSQKAEESDRDMDSLFGSHQSCVKKMMILEVKIGTQNAKVEETSFFPLVSCRCRKDSPRTFSSSSSGCMTIIISREKG